MTKWVLLQKERSAQAELKTMRRKVRLARKLLRQILDEGIDSEIRLEARKLVKETMGEAYKGPCKITTCSPCLRCRTILKFKKAKLL